MLRASRIICDMSEEQRALGNTVIFPFDVGDLCLSHFRVLLSCFSSTLLMLLFSGAGASFCVDLFFFQQVILLDLIIVSLVPAKDAQG